MPASQSQQRKRTPGSAWRLTSTVVACLWIAAGPPAPAASPVQDAPSDLELRVKAVFIYNFAKFAEWPELAPGAPIVIGIVGNDEISASLHQSVDGKTVEGHSSRTVNVRTIGDAKGCQVLFFGGRLERRSLEILAAVRTDKILTIGEMEEFAGAGGMLQLYLDHNRVAFGANLNAINRSGLHISSKLLKLARVLNPNGERP